MNEISQLESLFHLGHYAQARAKAQDLLTTRDELRIKQLYALSLSKSGVPEAAQEYFEGVVGSNPEDPESMGILGGIYKELFKKNQSTKFALLSRDTYDKNFQITKNYYTGINAAAMSMLAGQSRRGKEIAQEVLASLKNTDTDFWEAATQGEALLLLKERAKSEEAYKRARGMVSMDWGKINSVYNQLWLLKHYLPVPSEVLKMFSPPVIVSFMGHMIDQPGRSTPRFPETIEGPIKAAIQNSIRTMNAKIGYCSLACGGDILFAEAMEEESGELNLFLPFRLDDFIESSVRFAGQHWVDRFMRLIHKHPVTFLTQEAYDNHPDLFFLTTQIIFGVSTLRSKANHQEPTLLMVMSDRDRLKKTGGVRDTLQLWPFPKNQVTINPDVYLPPVTDSAGEARPGAQQTLERSVLYLVCCDLTKDEKLDAALLEQLEIGSLPPLALDVRDDKIIAGFKTIFSAVEFCNLVTKTFVRPFQQTSIARLSMHVGPFHIDPSAVKQKMSGPLIDMLEKLHSITLMGSIYATNMIAAILALDTKKYSFDYVDTLATQDTSRDLDVFKVRINQTIVPV